MHRLAHVIGAAEAVLLAGFAVYSVVDKGASLELLFVLFLVSAAATGWLVASRVPTNPIGWLLLFIAGAFALAVPAYGLVGLFADRAPTVAAWGYWVAGTGDWGWIWLPPVGAMVTQLLLLFPDGHLPSTRWRWFFWFTVVSLVGLSTAFMLGPADFPHGLHNPIGQQWLEDLAPFVLTPLVLGLAASVIGSVASLFVRYRHADGIVREQIRWVAWGAGMVVLAYAGSWLVPGDSLDNLVAGLYGLIPISIGIAVLRFHLYDIDRIISRTVSYALVTGTLLAVYASVVTLLSRLIPASSHLAVAAATLIAAALLRPLLSRVRQWVDRRFNRSRYDAAHMVEDFSAGLRSAVDSQVVLTDLVRTTHEAVQPRTVSVWLPDVGVH